MKKLLKFFTFLMLVLGLASCASVEGIEITSANNLRTIKVGETLQLEAKVYPENANQKVEWTSTDTNIATVNEDGLVSAVLEGRVSIVATSTVNKDVSQEFALIIEEKEPEVIVPTSVTISAKDDKTTCSVGEKIFLSYKLLPEGASQKVIWTSSDATIGSVLNGTVTALKEGKVIITATVEGYETIVDTIELTFEKASGPIQTKDWPNMEYSTHNDYVTVEKGTPLKVKGVVTHVCPGDTEVSYFIQNGKDGYYVYKQDAAAFPVELGKTYEVGGFKAYYQGLNEISDVEYFKELDTPLSFEVNTLEGIDASSLEAMKPYHGSKVTGEAEFESAKVNTKAYNFNAKINGKSVIFRVDPAYMSAEEFNKINTLVSSVVEGTKFTFNGFVTAFGYGTPKVQIQIASSSDLVFSSISAEEVLAVAINNIDVSSFVSFASNTISLPTAPESFEDLTITWSSDSELINVVTGNVTHGSEDTTVTLTAKLTLDGKEKTKTFEVLVEKADSTVYETVAKLDLEDALAPTQESNGGSPTKQGYAEAVVNLGTPKANWLLRNALIAAIANDRVDGMLSIRAKSSDTAAETGRIEIQQDGEYNVVDFDAAVYGNDDLGIQIRVEYSLDGGSTWVVADKVISVYERELTTYRVVLPEGVKRVALVVVENSGNRVNIDNIELKK